MHRKRLDRTLVWPLFWVLAMLATGCLHENAPTLLRGEISREGAHYIVQECVTERRFELKLIAHSQVTLERRLKRVEDEAPEVGPILVELGGKVLPATTATKGNALFDVFSLYAVRPGSCR